MPGDEFAFTSAYDLRGVLDSKKVSAVELTEMFLRRIEALNPRLNAYLTVTGDEALAAARQADRTSARGAARGPLHGIPTSIKDLDITRGIRTTMGSLAYKDYVPDQDSVVVERVRKAGAIILGKTNTPEFGFLGTTENRLGEPCRNPWNPQRTSGGSSGGAAAAMAAGLCALATGSDGGGSIRIPCSFTGTFGIKPSQGRVPRYGGVGRPSYNLMSQAGPITRTVRDSALLLQVLAGPDPRDPTCIQESPPDFVKALDQGARGLRIAWSANLGYAPVDPEVVAITSRAARTFEELGCIVDEPGIQLEDPLPTFMDVFCINGYTSYGHLLDDRRGELTDYGVEMLEHGRSLSAADYSRRLVQVQQMQARMSAIFDQYDLLLTPVTAVTAFPPLCNPTVIGGQRVEPYMGYTPFTSLINMTMHTAASVPCGFSAEGMPVGLHVIARRGSEATVLRAAVAFEQARPWAGERPPVS